MSSSQQQGVPSFGHFLEYLRLNKFEITVTHYSRVGQVLKQIGDDFTSHPERLKSHLRPIFAVNEAEQRRFSKVYDDYVEYCQKTFPGKELPKSVEGGARLTLAGYAGAGRVEEPTRPGARGLLQNWRKRVRRHLTPRNVTIAVLAIAFVFLVVQFLIRRQQTTTTNPKEAPQTTPPPSPSIEAIEQITPPTPLPTPQDQSSPASDSETSKAPLVPPPMFYLAIATVMMLFLTVYVLVHRGLRSLNPANYENKKPPFRWPLRSSAPTARFDLEQFRSAARMLRRRQVDEFFRLDLGATVSATIRSLGYPSFRYRPATRVPEYLALIERFSPHDHQARLFDQMVQALKRESVVVTRYFYGDDPLVCCDESGKGCVRLERLRQRHAGHRLLIFGNGENFLDPVTGRVAEWLSIFSIWHERALLTPESNWGWREELLLQKFIVVPAETQGLITLTNHLGSPAAMSSSGWPAPDAHPLPIEVGNQISLDKVRDYLGPQLFQWLCACAIYPELQWELTLRLGALTGTRHESFNEKDMMRLFRLSWFRKGTISDATRGELLEAFESGLDKPAREEIVRLLQSSQPPLDTYAFNEHQFELALQKWLLFKDQKNLDKLRRAVKRIPRRQISRSTVLSRLLEMAPHKYFGYRLPRLFFRHGLPILGFNPLVHAMICLIALGATLGLIRARANDVPEWAYASLLPRPTPEPSSTTGDANTNSNANINVNADINTNFNANVNTNFNANMNVNAGTNINGSGPSPNTNGQDMPATANGISNANSASPPTSESRGEIYRDTIDEDINMEEKVKEEIDPVLKQNPNSVIYVIAGDVATGEYIQKLIDDESGFRHETVIIDSGEADRRDVEVVVKSKGAAPPVVRKVVQLPLSLPPSARKIGEFSFPDHLDDAQHDAGKINNLADLLQKNPTAHGYLVANSISNGRTGENRFEIHSMASDLGFKDRLTVLLRGDGGDNDVLHVYSRRWSWSCARYQVR